MYVVSTNRFVLSRVLSGFRTESISGPSVHSTKRTDNHVVGNERFNRRTRCGPIKIRSSCGKEVLILTLREIYGLTAPIYLFIYESNFSSLWEGVSSEIFLFSPLLCFPSSMVGGPVVVEGCGSSVVFATGIIITYNSVLFY